MKIRLPHISRWIVLEGDAEAVQLYSVKKQIIKLLEKSRQQQILLHMRSTGGDLPAATGFYQWVKYFNIPLITLAMGEIASAGVCIFLSGTRRYALPDTYFYFHHPESDSTVKMTQVMIEAEARGLRLYTNVMKRIIVKETRISQRNAANLLSSVNYIPETKALEMGIIHTILSREAPVKQSVLRLLHSR